ncbi:GNAT family N-acetyltransferase [Vibrio astriarenae]|uniref:GNAT family N-acetyltransferase n=1 Tax=Vibrio astriarenae TaxID=1481923 RepID=A0A7Z2T3P4_9VIBR|nr:GNAT family protein [Vibrio astriarenae]QIA63808.1 GNAT family N-acetyltransferase [Vibrio astriarenae]
MSPDFSIITDSLELKLLSDNDAEQLQSLICHSPSLHQWIDWCQPDFSLEQAQRFIYETRLNWVKSSAYGFGVFARQNKDLVGMVVINELYHTFNMVSIGYWVADQYQNQGLGKKSVTALVNFCFEMLKVTRIEAVCDPCNSVSRQLIERCGGQFETIARNRYIYENRAYDGAVYSIIP